MVFILLVLLIILLLTSVMLFNKYYSFPEWANILLLAFVIIIYILLCYLYNI